MFKKYLFIIFSFSLSSSMLNGQSTAMEQDHGTWNTLAMVTYEKEFDEDFGMDIDKPVVSPLISSLDGKEVTLQGFIIPLTGKVEQSHFMLSKFPQSMCFFCGKAGPESAAQVFTKDGKKIPFTDKKVKVKGILRVNTTEITNLLYTIEDGVIIN